MNRIFDTVKLTLIKIIAAKKFTICILRALALQFYKFLSVVTFNYYQSLRFDLKFLILIIEVLVLIRSFLFIVLIHSISLLKNDICDKYPAASYSSNVVCSNEKFMLSAVLIFFCFSSYFISDSQYCIRWCMCDYFDPLFSFFTLILILFHIKKKRINAIVSRVIFQIQAYTRHMKWHWQKIHTARQH